MTGLKTVFSPLGPLLLASDGEALTGLWLKGQRYFAVGVPTDAAQRPELPAFLQAEAWLAAYFSKAPLPPMPPLAPRGTAFQCAVWQQLTHIPYGTTTTYGALAHALGVSSPRAVGSAVGRNPISILIPCHRVLGSDGSLTGYAGGLERKRFLLELEGAAAALRT